MASMHCLQVSPDIAALPGSGVWAVLVLVTSGHVTINSPRAAPAPPDLNGWVRGATWVVNWSPQNILGL